MGSYVGETGNSETTRLVKLEDQNPKGKPEPTKHLHDNATHKFFLKIFSFALSHFCRRKVFKEFFIALTKLESSDQVENNSFSPLGDGIL